MKPLSLAVILAAALLAAPAHAQDLPALELTKWTQGGPGGPEPSAHPPLRQNVTLSIKGGVLSNLPVDATWTGVGPEFKIDLVQVIDGKRVPSTCHGEIWATEDGYRIKCAVIANMPMLETHGKTKYVSYSQVGPDVTVLLKPGQSIPLLIQGNQTTTLTLVQGTTDYASQQQAAPAPAPAVLPQNMRVDFTGQGFDDSPVDIGLTTVSSSFSVNIVTSGREVNGVMEPIITHCNGSLTPTPDGYLLNYGIGCNLPVVVSWAVSPDDPDKTTQSSVIYMSVDESSAVALSPGVPVTVFNVNGKPLTVQVAPAAKK
jgi:hypothetical protein